MNNLTASVKKSCKFAAIVSVAVGTTFVGTGTAQALAPSVQFAESQSLVIPPRPNPKVDPPKLPPVMSPAPVGSPVDPAKPKVEVPDPAPIPEPEPAPEPAPAPKPVSVPLEENVISNPFGYRYGVNPYLPADYAELHNGIDFAAPMDTPIRSVKSGTVDQVFSDLYGGLRTVVHHDDGSYATYSHQNNQWVQPGQHVERGDEIGTVGTTGNSTGPHLHFEYGENGVDVDPAPVFDDF